MKALKIYSLVIAVFVSTAVFAQESKQTFKVAGECGMCKTKIEKAAKNAGASYAVWNIEKKELTVKYNSTSTNTAKIQEAIAKVGYDTPKYKATDEDYNKLHECCKYERTDDCCGGETCSDAKEECCKDKSKMDCCKDGKCTKEGHDVESCCKQ